MTELTRLVHADWSDLAVITEESGSLFESLLQTGRLESLLDGLLQDDGLRQMCERYDFLDKLVLFSDPETGVRLRLHLFRAGYFDRPHNHRWSFASRIVSGRYAHRLYGREDVLLEANQGDPLLPIMERVERPGDEYVLHHNSVHAVAAEEDTISLVLRGPACKDKFLILDREEGTSFWVHGAADESAAKRAEKIMSPEVLTEVVEHARDILSRARPRA